MSFLRSNRRRNTVLGVAIAAAVSGGLLLVGAGHTIVARLQDETQRRYGTAQLTLPAGGALILAGGAGWIDESQARRIAEVLTFESVSVYPRVQSDAVLVSEEGFTTVSIVSGTDEEIAKLTTGPGPDPSLPQSLLVGYAGAVRSAGENGAGKDTAGTAGFINLGEAGVSWTPDPRISGLVWVETRDLLRALHETGVAPEATVGNVLLMGSGPDYDSPDDRSPAVVAFNAAEILVGEFPQAEVQSRLDLAGRTGEMSAGNISLLLRIALALPAIAAVIGSVLVTAESRSDEVTLLRTMGFDAPAIRALFVREVFMVAGLATLAALTLALGATVLIPGLTIAPRSIAGFIFVGGLFPPGLAFLTTRRFLSDRLGDRLAEFRR